MIPVSASTVPGKECLPIFESLEQPGTFSSISGGVGAATRESLPRVSIVNPAKPLGARKPPAVNLTGDKTGTAVRAVPHRSGKLVTFDGAKGIPTRDASGDIALGTPRITFKAGAKPEAIEIHAGEPKHPIGVVAAERNGPNVKMSWRAGAVEEARHDFKWPKNLGEADQHARFGDVVGAAPVFEAAAANTPPATTLDRARALVVDAAHRRTAAVQKELSQIAASGEKLSPAAQEMLVKATRAVGTPAAAEHVGQSLAKGLPLANAEGTLVTERGTLIVTRDIARLETAATPIPPATNLAEHGIFIDRQLRIGQEGALPDLGGQAARWQHRPDVRMSSLKQHPVGPPPDQVVETSTATKFDYIPPRTGTGGPTHPPIVIRKCDDRQQTPQTSDDC